MDCNACRQLAAFRRSGGPAELAPEDAAALDRHLAGCPGCSSLLARQDAFDGAVSRAMQAVPVPNGLRDRLLADAMARRGADWRHALAKGAAATGFTVVLLVTLWSGYLNFFLPVFSTDQLADAFAEEYENPEGVSRRWLAEDEGLPPDFPPNLDFDFRNYDRKGYALVDGRRVPVVGFKAWPPGADRPYRADVYIVRPWQFDAAKIKPAQNSFCNVQAFRDERTGVVYVVLYTSPSLNLFLKPNALQGPF